MRFLTFEVEADDGAPTIGGLLADSSNGRILCDDDRTVLGYAAHGAHVRAAIEPIVDHFALALVDDGEALTSVAELSPLQIPATAIGCRFGAEEVSRIQRTQAPARALPVAMTLGYYDPDRDYQAGQARASIGRGDGPLEHSDVAIVITASDAKGLAQASLARRWAERDRLRLNLLPSYLATDPGRLVAVEGIDGFWRIETLTIDGLVIRVELRPVVGAVGALSSDPGRPLPAPDAVAATTELALFDLPDLGLNRSARPTLHLAAANASAGWRPVPIEISVAGTPSAGQTAATETVLGKALTILAPGQAFLVDLVNSVTVELVDDSHWLENRDDSALANGANLAVLGDELIQFGTVEVLGERRFRLSRLLRGRRGSEWAMAGHGPGEPFAILSPASLRAIDVPEGMIGADVTVTAHGIADGVGAGVSRTALGEALRPPNPVHLKAEFVAGGTLLVTWVRRSRDGWGWVDGVDAPIGESGERYRVTITGTGGRIESETTIPEAAFAAVQLATVGPGPASLSIVQLGDLAASRPAVQSINL